MRWGLLAALLLATGFAAAASTAQSLAKADAAMAQAREDDMPLLAPSCTANAVRNAPTASVSMIWMPTPLRMIHGTLAVMRGSISA